MTNTTNTIKACAIQLEAKLADVSYNLQRADVLVERACEQGAQMVILPEFFTSAVGFDPAMLKVAEPLKGRAFHFLLDKAQKHQIIIGGSFISIKDDGHRYNTFILALPDGSYQYHDKDLPTMWENCYYRAGSDDGIVSTDVGSLGIAMCWEFIRTQTPKRLHNNIDLLIGGSCWWDVPASGVPLLPKALMNHASRHNKKVMKDTIATMAKMLGVPVVHSAHASSFTCDTPLMPRQIYDSHFLGETQIVDATGRVIKRMGAEEGEGIICADIQIGRIAPTLPIPQRFWIPRLHPLVLANWHYQNNHGKAYYAYRKLCQ